MSDIFPTICENIQTGDYTSEENTQNIIELKISDSNSLQDQKLPGA